MAGQNENKTFMEGLLIFLNGLPSVANTVLDTCAENVPVVGKYIKPTFWTLIAVLLLQGLMVVTGGDAVLEGAWNRLMELIPSFTFGSAPAVVPPVTPTDVPIVPGS